MGAASWPSCVPGSLNAKYPERVVSGEKAPEAINDRTRTSSLKGGARRSREYLMVAQQLAQGGRLPLWLPS